MRSWYCKHRLAILRMKSGTVGLKSPAHCNPLSQCCITACCGTQAGRWTISEPVIDQKEGNPAHRGRSAIDLWSFMLMARAGLASGRHTEVRCDRYGTPYSRLRHSILGHLSSFYAASRAEGCRQLPHIGDNAGGCSTRRLNKVSITGLLYTDGSSRCQPQCITHVLKSHFLSHRNPDQKHNCDSLRFLDS